MWFKEILKKMVAYFKRHVFHFGMVVALIIMAVVQVSQFTYLGTVSYRTSATQKNLDEYKTEMVEVMQNARTEFTDAIEAKGREISEQMDEAKMELNSRIDVVDSAIKPEKKRRQLIVKVRDAITENTDTKLTIRELNNIAIAIIDYSYQYNLSIARVLAQIKQESDFKIKAKSHARAMGLMQVIPETWEYVVLKEFDHKSADPYNIYHNIRAGCFYMSEQVLKFETYDQALMAYNWGPHNMRSFLAGDIPEDKIPNETTGYVQKINQHIQTFEKYGLE